MEERSFTVKVYLKATAHGNGPGTSKARLGTLMTSMRVFRLFHPEGNAFVQASCDPDKGEVSGGQKGCVVVVVVVVVVVALY